MRHYVPYYAHEAISQHAGQATPLNSRKTTMSLNSRKTTMSPNSIPAQEEMSGVGVHSPEEKGHAHLYLAHYHVKRQSFSEAEAHAHKCREFAAVSK